MIAKSFAMKFRNAQFLFASALSFFAAPFAGAMIASISGKDGHNTDPTKDFLGNATSEDITEIWNRTVQIEGGGSPGTGTYLGKSSDGTHWVLTAAHVNPIRTGTLTIKTAGNEDISLSYTGGTSYYFYNEDGTKADLELFSVSADGDAATYLNSLGNIGICTDPLQTNTALYCVGTGANLSIGSGVSSESRVKQWGEFCADEFLTMTPESGYSYTNFAFLEFFSNRGSSVQCGMYDSGSGAFVKNDDCWEVAGVAVRVGGVGGVGNASSVGFIDESDNAICATYFVDLSKYASQIYAIIPEPAAFGLLAGIFALGFAGTRRRRNIQKKTFGNGEV